jgi:hypothetical protein
MPYPSFDNLLPETSCAVQVGELKNLIWTGLKFSVPPGLSLEMEFSHALFRGRGGFSVSGRVNR